MVRRAKNLVADVTFQIGPSIAKHGNSIRNRVGLGETI